MENVYLLENVHPPELTVLYVQPQMACWSPKLTPHYLHYPQNRRQIQALVSICVKYRRQSNVLLSLPSLSVLKGLTFHSCMCANTLTLGHHIRPSGLV